jgi:hypothetical protein
MYKKAREEAEAKERARYEKKLKKLERVKEQEIAIAKREMQ